MGRNRISRIMWVSGNDCCPIDATTQAMWRGEFGEFPNYHCVCSCVMSIADVLSARDL